MSQVLRVLSGLPGSGKSTLARQLLDEARKEWGRAGEAAVVCRDTIREHVLGLSMDPGEQMLDRTGERLVSMVETAMVRALLDDGVQLVIVDAMHRREERIDHWRAVAGRYGARLEVTRLGTPLEECVRRDAARGAAGGRSLGEDLIREIAARC